MPGQELNNEDYWRKEWELEQSRNAIVDVDVRGWVYSPHRGPLTRKHRLLVGLARQLSGIPAPPATRQDDSTGTWQADGGRTAGFSQQEEDLIAMEAEGIARKGRREEHFAKQGMYSENSGRPADTINGISNTSVNDFAESDRYRDFSPRNSVVLESEPPSPSLQARSSWPSPGRMNPTELTAANKHLITRLKPFMSTPRSETVVRAFFYNEHASKEHDTRTDASGHFSFRTPLDFVPSHVRILTGEDLKLSATEQVTVTPSEGVSLISDIDDTIKHSAISAGAREIFRNAFIRDLGDLTIDGVREWYTTLHDMGVPLHYVSNSPWQMYPILTTYFKLAHLPKGSFHLKQYSGMLQGIFEPVAERKKSSLDKILRDFPDRKFILVGDSGEADLEVYTDFALENPGRVIGIFIRDVTTTVKTGYFDPSYSPTFGGGSGRSRNHSRQKSGDALAMSKRLSRPRDIQDDDADLKAAIAASLKDMEEETRRARRFINPDPQEVGKAQVRNISIDRPDLPRRLGGQSSTTTTIPLTASPDEDLIDFTDPMPASPQLWLKPPSSTHPPPARVSTGSSDKKKPSPSPPPPPKPASLRSISPVLERTSSLEATSKQPPPRPRKPSSAVAPQALISAANQGHQPSPLSQVTRQESVAKERPPLPARPRTYREFAKEKIGKALPSANTWQMELPIGSSRPRTAGSSRVNSTPTSPLAQGATSAGSFEDLNLPGAAIPPPPPPRRNLSYSLGSSRRNSHARSASLDSDSMGSPGEGLNKKEYLWKQRLARAQVICERNGITLRTWKIGTDVAHVCVKLVEMELRELRRKNGDHRRT